MRLDQYLVQKGYFTSREKAKQAIEASQVRVNENIAKVSTKITPDKTVTIQKAKTYVSRSGHKLEAAAGHFNVSPKGKICLDVGSSTGGFTQYLLENDAKQVIAVDVGTDQLHSSIKEHPRLQLHENTDIRNFTPNTAPNLITADVSFISLRKIIPHLPNAEMLLLFKPQFECSKKFLKKGIYKHPNVAELIEEFGRFLATQALVLKGFYKVPLKGKEGNQEYFLHIRPSNQQNAY